MRHKLPQAMVWLTLSLWHQAVFADPVVWHVDGIKFTNGLLVTGSFTFNADTGQFSDIRIVSRRRIGDEFSPNEFAYRFDNPSLPSSASRLSFTGNDSFDGDRGLIIQLVEPLTNAGGAVEMDLTADNIEGGCSTSACEEIIQQTSVRLGRFVAADEILSQARWHLYDSVFDDGGIATGSFDMTDDGNFLPNTDVKTSQGMAGFSAEYFNVLSFSDSISGTFLSLEPVSGLTDFTGSSRLQYVWQVRPTLYGGSITHQNMVSNFEYSCQDSSCSSIDTIRHAVPGRTQLVAPAIVVSQCGTPNVLIPDNDSLGVTDSLNTHFAGEILDVNVSVNVPHSSVNDLIITLEHINSGTSVALMENQTDFNGDACTNANVDATFDDDNTSAVLGVCAGDESAVSGTFSPAGLLSALDGIDYRSGWRLTVADTVSGATGSFTQWCVEATLVSGPETRDIDGDAVVDEEDNCTLVANPLQQDTDNDGIGNYCDPDIHIPNDCRVNFADFFEVAAAFGSMPQEANWNPDADMNSDDTVDFLDVSLVSEFFLREPGPSTVPNLCL